MSKVFTLHHAQRLHSKKRIEQLFEAGRSVSAAPLRVIWHFEPTSETESAGVQVLVSVSKRFFKRSNKRNLLKRRMREAWRLSSTDFCQYITLHNKRLSIALLYTKNELIDYSTIKLAVEDAVSRLRRHKDFAFPESLSPTTANEEM